MFDAMEALGHIPASSFRRPVRLSGARKDTNVLILGAGLAGLVAAYELRRAGYKVQVLEYQGRTGGRNWTLRGGDTHVELGGASQHVRFARGNYLNPGPWRIPARHHALLHYCRELGVQLESFCQLNGEAYVHSSRAFGGKPQRYREVSADFTGHVSELLAKAVDRGSLDQQLVAEDRERLIEALRVWGRLDEKNAYGSNLRTAAHRGFANWPGPGVGGAPSPSKVADLHDVLDPMVWKTMDFFLGAQMQPTIFQPVGGMDMIGRAFTRQLRDVVTLNARVARITQDRGGVIVGYEDMTSRTMRETRADWCICALPLTVLGQMELQVSEKMRAAIRAVPYGPHVKIGLEFKRRFWEQDDGIFGGISWTDQQIGLISYPSGGFQSDGPATLLGAYQENLPAYALESMTPEARIEAALSQGEKIHPQYRKEYLSGVSVAWSRVPWILGCHAVWNKETRETHYANLCAIDGHLVLAGDHCTYLEGWQEGALLSGIDAATRIHKRALEASV
jgi:monoamine oxidase